MAAQKTDVEGAAQVLNGLEPGVSAHFVYGATGGEGALLLSGHTVTFSSEEGAVDGYCRWALPDSAIYPGVRYTLTLSGSKVLVTADG
jgi:hypothetical protein